MVAQRPPVWCVVTASSSAGSPTCSDSTGRRLTSQADRLSSAISDAVVDQIDTSMGLPATCPHGNVIPGRDIPYGVLVALADLEPEVPAIVRRISEVAEHDAPALLSMLADHAIHEGSEVRVIESDVGPSEVALTVAGNELVLSLDAARLIWVQPT